MKEIYIKEIAARAEVALWQAQHCIELLEEGATVPFISRYRKERTGSLDEIKVGTIKFELARFKELDARKEGILKSIREQDKLSAELKEQIENCLDSRILEDIYLPYKPKRRTKASIAIEKGLEPLADRMMSLNVPSFERTVHSFVNKEVANDEEALEGARNIIAERISQISLIRQELRKYYSQHGRFQAKAARNAKGNESENEDIRKEQEVQAAKYASFINKSEDLRRMPAHRLLAALRGAEEGFLSVGIDIDEDTVHRIISKLLYNGQKCSCYALYQQMEEAISDSARRLLHPSIENEALAMAKEKADLDSIQIFGENLRQLLLAPPLGQKRTLAIDPGFRTGCKVVCLDEQGALLHNDTIYPHPPQNEKIMAMKKLSNMIESYKIQIIAIGNGTAGRETEAFLKKFAMPERIKVYSVSEDGASIYSASAVAREEFPEYDVTVRGAVSIGRRLMDPLAELVKIDPKSLGVGQYQHDVNQTLLKEKLNEVVMSAVNSVGVNLNTASKHLLSYVSGIGESLAQNIVDYRNENGAFRSRNELLKVKRLGAKAFEQAAGFLRIPGAANPLDNSAVHPEQYGIVARMAASANIALDALIGNKQLIDSIDLNALTTPDTGMITLKDIANELAKPGRDPRESIKILEFSNEVQTIDDLRIGMELPGIITNITAFGAFVDFGIKENGLIHISQMGKGQRVNSPQEVVKLHQHVQVKVIDVDTARRRIALRLESIIH